MTSNYMPDEIVNAYALVFDAFKVSKDKIAEAVEEVDTYRKSSEENNCEDGDETADIIKRHSMVLQKYTRISQRAFEMFESCFESEAGNVNNQILQVGQKAVEILLSIQEKAENSRKIIVKMRNSESIDNGQ